MASQQPAEPLRGVVRTYVGYRENSLVPVRRREIPTGDVALIMSFGPKIEVIGGQRHSSFVAAVADTWSDTEYLGEQYGLEIMMRPLGASRLLGLPLDELTGVVVELEDLLGVRAGLLIEQLTGLPDWPSRFALVDSVLPRWLADGRAPSPLVEYAWQRITATDGRIPIGALVDELGCSRRHLLGQFRAHVGVPPKSLARVLRCRRAMRLLTAGGRSIADIAQECGYYDHSHLDRDFRLITGVAPARKAAVDLTPDGRVGHAELRHDGGIVMVSSAPDDVTHSVPDDFRHVQCTTYLAVSDVDAHHDRAVAAGAEIAYPLTDQDYGSRDYSARDLEGNHWHFGTYRPV